MELLNFFPTPLWLTKLDLDTDKIKTHALKFCSSTESVSLSNVGGHQADNYHNKILFQEIGNNIPRSKDKPLSKYRIYSWVNVNESGHYNKRHTHLDTRIFLSGVYYVKAPKNCGNIRFYDPRGAMLQDMTDHKYFYGGHTYNYIIPEENTLMFFPSWLEHDVEENNSGDTRISIAFNIFVE